MSDSNSVPYQNHAGLRGPARHVRPYPLYLKIGKSSACGFVLPNLGMLGDCASSPVIRHGFVAAGRCGARSGPIPCPRAGGGLAPAVLRRAAESFSKIVLASPFEFPYSTSSHGGVAQLGERLTGSQEVRGSIPLVSTRALNEAPTQVGAFFHISTQGQRRHHDPSGR